MNEKIEIDSGAGVPPSGVRGPSDEEFRDHMGTVDKEGKRLWIYPKKPSGNFHRWRVVVTVILLSLLFAGPIIKINGQTVYL